MSLEDSLDADFFAVFFHDAYVSFADAVGLVFADEGEFDFFWRFSY